MFILHTYKTQLIQKWIEKKHSQRLWANHISCSVTGALTISPSAPLDSNSDEKCFFSWEYKKDLVDRFYEYARENLEELKIWKDDQDGIHVSFALKYSNPA